jgi:hypothetical protein
MAVLVQYWSELLMKFIRNLVLMCLAAASVRAEIVDRMVAVVNGHVITWSAVLADANYQAFRSGGEPVTTLQGEALKIAISKMADQELLRNEEANTPETVTDNAVAERVLQSIRQRFPGPGEFARALADFHLTEEYVNDRVAQDSSLLTFIDDRLRPQARVLPGEIEVYYRTVLVPKVGAQRQNTAPPLDQVSGDIEKVLTEQEINRLLDEWLAQLRSRAHIRIVEASTPE